MRESGDLLEICRLYKSMKMSIAIGRVETNSTHSDFRRKGERRLTEVRTKDPGERNALEVAEERTERIGAFRERKLPKREWLIAPKQRKTTPPTSH